MSIPSYLECLKSAALKNPIVEATTDLLSKINAIPLEGLAPEVIASLEVTKQKMQEQADKSGEWLSGVKNNLPLMKASDVANAKLKIMQGITPSADGGDLVKGVSGTLDNIAQKSADFNALVSGQIQNLPVGDPVAIAGFISDLTTGAQQHLDDVDSNLSSVTDSIGTAISDLKDYAFAKFSAMPQPPALSELMSKILPDTCRAPRAEVIKAEEDIAREVVEKKYEQATSPASPTSTDLFEVEASPPATNTTDIPAPVVNGRTPQQLKDSVYEQIDSLYDKKRELSLKTTELLVETRNKKYQLYPDYDDVKKRAGEGDLSAINKYEGMLADMRRIPPFTTWVQKHAEYAECDQEINRLQKLLKEWSMNNYTNVPNGPPW